MSQALWQPSKERIQATRLFGFQNYLHRKHAVTFDDYQSLHQWSVEQRELFWQAIWDFCGVKASQQATSQLTDGDKMPGAKWFEGARLNFAENLLRNKSTKTALVSYLENGTRREVSYGQLCTEVEKLASALRAKGVVKGDRVAGFMPNIIETIVAMLATTSIGAVWSSCSPDFGLQGVMDRFGQIEPKVLITLDGYFYNGKTIDSLPRVKAITDQLPSLEAIVVVPVVGESGSLDLSSMDRAVEWSGFINSTPTKTLEFEQLPFDHPVYIMYSSGTTGVPKCIVHGAGGTLLQHLKEHQLHTDVTPDDVLFYFTTCGWMMWNWLVSGLASGTTLVLFDGSPFANEGNILIDMIDSEEISIFGTSAKYIAALEKAGIKPKATHRLSKLKAILSTGSPLSHESFAYIYRDFKSDVCLSSISGGTDIVSCFALGNPALPVYTGELQCPGLGMAVEIWDDEGNSVVGEKGELVCTKAFPSTPIGFWNDPDDKKFHKSYFESYDNIWAHGDYGEITESGGLIIHGRSDAVLNPGGVRIGTAEIYRQVEKVEQVLDSIVIGQEWQDDVRVVLFVVLREGVKLNEELSNAIKQVIRSNTTPRHVPAKIIQVADIPKTISGKIVELAVREVVHGREVKNQDALANPQALALFQNLPALQC